MAEIPSTWYSYKFDIPNNSSEIGLLVAECAFLAILQHFFLLLHSLSPLKYGSILWIFVV